LPKHSDVSNENQVLAKPSGISLKQHREHVMSEGKILCTHYPFTFKKYNEKVGKSLYRRLELVTKYHDDGKECPAWQRACQLDYKSYLNWQKKNIGSFQKYARNQPGKAGRHLLKAKIRHEFQSLVIHESKNIPICLQAAIAAHHGKLGFRFEKRWFDEGVERFWKIFQKESNRTIDERLTLSNVANLHYEYAGPRGLLQLADRRASAREEGENIPEHRAFKYEFPYRKKRNVQKMIEECWRDKLLLVRAATGAGKTDASLLWASLQIHNERADRLIIAMPTRFTSNALSINVAENLSKTGLYHSSAWFTKFHDQVESGNLDKKDASKEHEFARLLQTSVTVCTIDHLLMALTLTREDHHLIAFNLANSCLVIDEADFYDDFTQANILVLLEILNHWSVPVLLMSASLPDVALIDYRKIGYTITEIKKDTLDEEEYYRSRFAIKSISNCANADEIHELLERCIAHGSAIIYANTVDRAIDFLKWFDNKNINVCLYHSRYTEPDKMKKEKELINMLGQQAWERGNAKGIAILTQIGEMSINISADIMISDLSPIDRLTQRAGRLNRFNKSKLGELHVLIPMKDGKIYPAPYGSYIKKEKSWKNSEAFDKTKEKLLTEEFSAAKLVSILNQVYDKPSQFSIRAKSNADNLKEYFKCNWLISSKQISNKDDSEVNFWSSRDIAPQETVFIHQPESHYFSNYMGFQEWKLKNGLELPIYLLERGKRNSMVDMMEIIIKEEKEKIYILRGGFYSFEKGVDFSINQFL